MKHISTLIGTFVLVGITAAASPAHAQATKDFKAGSLIIPATSVYQTDCGAVSMYGLIYNILRANTWLDADPGYGPIEVYYAYNTSKLSPNRCTPTNKHGDPTVSTSWTDGCDFTLSDSLGTTNIVSLVNNKVATTDSTITTINTNGKTNVYPTYNLAQQITAASGVNTVRYSGGAFIIDKSDADTFLGLLRGSITATDNGVAISYAPWRLSDASGNPTACTFNSNWTTSTVGGWVNIHRSLVDFTAPVPKLFNAAPPRLALLALDKNSKTGTLSNGILQGYLSRAGLVFSGAYGCPTNSPWKTNTTTCPSGDTSGEIFDTFDFQDVLDGKLDATKYKMFWAPHWELSVDRGSTDEQTMISNISSFLESTTGVMSECASIEAFEGSQNKRSGTQAKYQTCRDEDAPSGTCDATTSSRGFQVNSAGWYSADPNGTLRNCSDVNLAAGSDCFYISYPTDPYVQIGDYRWYAGDGVVADFYPKTTSTKSTYKPGVLPLISGVSDLLASDLDTPAEARASGRIKGDYVSRNQKDNLSSKGNILYLGGHDLTTSVAGTKVALETLLQLGTPEITSYTVEISRAMPIIAVLGTGEALVQGTYESVQPTAGNPKLATLDTDLDAFEFPFVKGHLRGYTNVTTTATSFEDLGASTWDATTLIPTANYSGCTAYTASCRTVFTNLDQNCNKGGTACTNTVFSDTTALSLGVVMADDLGDTATIKLVRRTLEGVPDSTLPNLYKARLGGIDRSTVAVIPQSSLAGLGARPTMIYVGASDGMMHAICGDNTTPCDTPGRELWAYMPRNQLAAVRNNKTRIDGSPRIQDLYGDFDGTGKSYRTIMVFQSSSEDSAIGSAVYALDVTFPNNPKVLWEFPTAGRGLSITMGKASNGKVMAFAQTNMGDTTAGSLVYAIDIETGTAVWTNSLTYPAVAGDVQSPRSNSVRFVPASGIPGGAVGVDLTNSGSITDVVFTTLYGQIYRLNAATGINPYDPSPLFSFNDDFKPFGAAPALFSSGEIYAVAASGGYVDYDTDTNALWTSSSTMQQAVAVAINTPVASAPLDEDATLSPNGLKFVYDLGLGQLNYSQAQIIGDQIFLTSDNTDVNATSYGTGGDTGKLHRIDLNGANAATVVVMGGAASIGRSGTTTYAASGDKAQQLSLSAASNEPTEGVNSGGSSKVERRLWLRTL